MAGSRFSVPRIALIPLMFTVACGASVSSPAAQQATATASTAANQSAGGRCPNECLPPNVKLDPLCVPTGLLDNYCTGLCTNTNFVGPGDTITAGDMWTPWFTWITNAKGGAPGFPLKYTDSYKAQTPPYLLEDPLLGFLTYLTAIRVTVDAGTRQERVHFYGDPDMKPVGYAALNPLFCQQTSDPFFQELCEFPAAWFVKVLHPLSVGTHTVTVDWQLSQESCDGVDTIPGFDCLPAGWSKALVPTFGVESIQVTVVPGH